MKKFLARDVSTFEVMIHDNYIYVDKTKHIYNLYDTKDRYHFLSRPRRFGKSLLISTLKELFSGNRELFKDLWIDQSDFPFMKHPVIHLDFSAIAHRSAADLEISLHTQLDQIAQENAIDLAHIKTFEDKLAILIPAIAQTNKIVLLVDEYDHPLLKHLSTPEIAKECQIILKSFYDAIKGKDAYFRAIFITGVSKFSKTSIFSGLNNLQDISEHERFADLLGYTEEEIAYNFEDPLQDFAHKKNITVQNVMQEMKNWYNGYRFSKAEISVYNPFSVVYYLKDQLLANYWFSSGTPTFLVELLKKEPQLLCDIENQIITSTTLGSFEIDKMPSLTLFYQAGYLTIKGYERTWDTDTYTLGYPNEEVKRSISMLMLGVYTDKPKEKIESILFSIRMALYRTDLESFCTQFKKLFAHIPYNLHIESESYYHSIIQIVLYLLGLDAQSEIRMSNGSIDLAVEVKNIVYVFEFKLNRSAKHALKQIHEREYDAGYQAPNKKIILVGIAFNVKNAALSIECEYQALP